MDNELTPVAGKGGTTISIPELLVPAGNMERLETAIRYGADAVYLGGRELNLRAGACGFGREELPVALDLAKKSGTKVYYCLNAFPREEHLPAVRSQLQHLADICVQGPGPDGLIVADPGVLTLAAELLPEIPLHVSTQANTANSAAVRFWQNAGATRVNLARETRAKEIQDIALICPDMELEVFVHGAVCLALSGRCLLSSYLNDRPANLGQCTHPCRFEYRPLSMTVAERTRPDQELWEVVEYDASKETGGYSAMFAPHDLCLLMELESLTRMGVSAVKIEGRTKTASYLAQVTDAYRTALDTIASGNFDPRPGLPEVVNAATRPLSTHFFKGRPELVAHPPGKEDRKPVLARLLDKLESGRWRMAIKSRWNREMDVEILVPGLKRPRLAAGSYGLETEGEKRNEVHSGMEAELISDHPDLAAGLMIRLAG